ncbi:MAG TPA: cyclic nucleotide-binding domain-containing protein [Acidimicrobiales bacterium]|nr:cyclic nucleotide-binding domain-containing protein [Acidimicrobiales bacterium]
MGERAQAVKDVFASALHNRVLRRVELSHGLFTGAEWAVWISLLVFAYEHGGTSASSLIAVVQLVPCALLGPLVVGALVDRHRPGRVLVAGYVVQCTAMAGVARAIATGAPRLVVFVLAPVVNIGVSVTGPAQAALVPSIVRTAEELTASNVMAGWLEQASRLVLPAVAGRLGRHLLVARVAHGRRARARGSSWCRPGWPPVGTGGYRTALVAPAVLVVAVAAGLWRPLQVIDDAADVPQVQIQLLRSIRIFAVLPTPALEGVARRLVPVTARAGTVVVREGATGDRYDAIGDGVLTVHRDGADVATLRRGEGFGEIALVHGVERMASVRAETDCLLGEVSARCVSDVEGSGHGT